MSDVKTFSPYQNAIFEAVKARRGSLAVKAVAGAGKTTTIVEAAKLTDPTDTLFCAFNVHTKDALAKRLPAGMTVLTIHGLGFRTLTAALGKLQNPDGRKYRTLIDERIFQFTAEVFGDLPTAEDVKAAREALQKLTDMARLTLTDLTAPGAVLAMADRYGIEAVTPANSRAFGKAVAALLEDGKKLATTRRLIDFTDMIWLPSVLRLRPDTFGTVFVDEAQDLSAAQTALVLSALAPGGRLIAVGDPRQAIYGFAGADCRSFEKVRDAAKATELPLSVCYRCPSKVIDLARTIEPTIEPAPGAPEGIVADVAYDVALAECRPGDLILSRRTATLMKACLRLIARGKAAKVRGKEIGKTLTVWLDDAAKLRGTTYETLPKALETIAARRRARLAPDDEAKLDAIEDQKAALLVCFESLDAASIPALKARIEDLFADAGNVVWLSSIHKAKGLEAERVWILEFDSLPLRRRRQTPEEFEQEMNLKYVAVTRALAELYLVSNERKAA